MVHIELESKLKACIPEDWLSGSLCVLLNNMSIYRLNNEILQTESFIQRGYDSNLRGIRLTAAVGAYIGIGGLYSDTVDFLQAAKRDLHHQPKSPLASAHTDIRIFLGISAGIGCCSPGAMSTEISCICSQNYKAKNPAENLLSRVAEYISSSADEKNNVVGKIKIILNDYYINNNKDMIDDIVTSWIVLSWLPCIDQKLFQAHFRDASDRFYITIERISSNTNSINIISLIEAFMLLSVRQVMLNVHNNNHHYLELQHQPPITQRDQSMNIHEAIRILHLSDFHFRPETAWDHQLILERLVSDIEKTISQGHPVDLVVITGDVAFSGKEEEYNIAQKWIEERLLPTTNTTPHSLFIVAGNHDVYRPDASITSTSFHKLLLSSSSEEAQTLIAKVLSDKAEKTIHTQRLRNFSNFLSNISGETFSDPWWSKTINIRGTSIHVTGLCSSWVSHKNNEQGDLIISRWQANKLTRGSDESGLSLCLMHHPWSYYAEWDLIDIQNYIRQSHDLILHGHLHIVQSSVQSDPDKSTIEIAAGACYGGGRFPNAYQIIEVFPSEVKVYFRCWHQNNWIPDRNRYQGAPNGVAVLPRTPRA